MPNSVTTDALVTPEMLEAGHQAYSDWQQSLDPRTCSLGEAIYRAMHRASTPLAEPDRLREALERIKSASMREDISCAGRVAIIQSVSHSALTDSRRTGEVTDTEADPSNRFHFEQWARQAVPQFSPSGKTIRGGEFAYNHNIVELMWQCWRAALAAVTGRGS